jgi:hypothetical protein
MRTVKGFVIGVIATIVFAVGTVTVLASDYHPPQHDCTEWHPCETTTGTHSSDTVTVTVTTPAPPAQTTTVTQTTPAPPAQTTTVIHTTPAPPAKVIIKKVNRPRPPCTKGDRRMPNGSCRHIVIKKESPKCKPKKPDNPPRCEGDCSPEKLREGGKG